MRQGNGAARTRIAELSRRTRSCSPAAPPRLASSECTTPPHHTTRRPRNECGVRTYYTVARDSWTEARARAFISGGLGPKQRPGPACTIYLGAPSHASASTERGRLASFPFFSPPRPRPRPSPSPPKCSPSAPPFSMQRAPESEGRVVVGGRVKSPPQAVTSAGPREAGQRGCARHLRLSTRETSAAAAAPGFASPRRSWPPKPAPRSMRGKRARAASTAALARPHSAWWLPRPLALAERGWAPCRSGWRRAGPSHTRAHVRTDGLTERAAPRSSRSTWRRRGSARRGGAYRGGLARAGAGARRWAAPRPAWGRPRPTSSSNAGAACEPSSGLHDDQPVGGRRHRARRSRRSTGVRP